MPSFLHMALIVCPLCFFAGFVDAIAGGGGLISIPAYLLAGLPPHLAMGSNKLSAAMGTATATVRYFRSGHIALGCALVAAALALPGSALGTSVLNRMQDTLVLRMLVIVLPIVASIVIFRRGALSPVVKLPEGWQLPVCGVIGFVIGFYDGLVGPGTGTFLILLFTMVVGMEAITASGSAKVVNLASNVGSLVVQIRAGNVYYPLALLVGCFTLVGSFLGVKMAVRGGEQTIRRILLLVLVLLLGNMGWELLRPK